MTGIDLAELTVHVKNIRNMIRSLTGLPPVEGDGE